MEMNSMTIACFAVVALFATVVVSSDDRKFLYYSLSTFLIID